MAISSVLAGELPLARKTHQMLGVFWAGLIALVGLRMGLASGLAIVDHAKGARSGLR